MGCVLSTPDGGVSVMGKADVVDIVRKYVGDEVAEYLSNNISEYDEKAERAKMEYNSDYLFMEQDIEEYQGVMRDIVDKIDELVDSMSKGKRVTRDKMFQQLLDIHSELFKYV